MQTDGQVDMFQTVKNVRIQRPAAVQTLVSEAGLVFISSACCTIWRIKTGTYFLSDVLLAASKCLHVVGGCF